MLGFSMPDLPHHVYVPYRPLWHQLDFHRARDCYYRWLDGGVGSAKTYGGLAECLMLAADIDAGYAGLIVVPAYPDFEDVVRPTIEEQWPADIYEIKNKQNRPHIYVETPKGTSEIYVRSAHDRRNVEKISGFKVAWAYWEEAARFAYGELVHRYCLQRIRQKINGEQAPYMGIFCASTPKPGWLPELFEVSGGLPPEAKRTGYRPTPDKYIRQARSELNPHNADQYASRQRAIYGDSDFGRQELDGDIVSASGLIYADFHKGLHVIPHNLALKLYAQSQRREGGVDWGWEISSMHWGGWCLGGGEVLVIVGEWYEPGKDAEHQGEYIRHNAADVGIWYCDTNEPGSIRKLQRMGIPATEAIKDRLPGFGSVRQLLHRRSGLDHPAHPYGNKLGCPRLLISEVCVHLIREFPQYRDANDPFDDKPYREGATVGDDHALDDLRYLVHTGSLASHDWTGVRANV